MTENNKYKFWIEQPTVLYTDGNYVKVFPTGNMSKVEQLNAITRMCIYVFILLYLTVDDSRWFYLPVVIIILITAMYYIYKFDPDGKTKEFYSKNQIYADNSNNNSNNIQSGYYDSNGELYIDSEYTASNMNNKQVAYSVNDLDKYNDATCRKPLGSNPFMNPLITEYNTEFPPQACNTEDENIKNLIEEKFNENLYMDITDMFSIKNSQRQFYTVPTPSIPNDQPGLANWLYKSPLTCKQNSEKCLRYDDIRFRRHL